MFNVKEVVHVDKPPNSAVLLSSAEQLSIFYLIVLVLQPTTLGLVTFSHIYYFKASFKHANNNVAHSNA